MQMRDQHREVPVTELTLVALVEEDCKTDKTLG
jgi:hypothetical protein